MSDEPEADLLHAAAMAVFGDALLHRAGQVHRERVRTHGAEAVELGREYSV